MYKCTINKTYVNFMSSEVQEMGYEMTTLNTTTYVKAWGKVQYFLFAIIIACGIIILMVASVMVYRRKCSRHGHVDSVEMTHFNPIFTLERRHL